jgi:hypothetical protein
MSETMTDDQKDRVNIAGLLDAAHKAINAAAEHHRRLTDSLEEVRHLVAQAEALARALDPTVKFQRWE